MESSREEELTESLTNRSYAPRIVVARFIGRIVVAGDKSSNYKALNVQLRKS